LVEENTCTAQPRMCPCQPGTPERARPRPRARQSTASPRRLRHPPDLSFYPRAHKDTSYLPDMISCPRVPCTRRKPSTSTPLSAGTLHGHQLTLIDPVHHLMCHDHPDAPRDLPHSRRSSPVMLAHRSHVDIDALLVTARHPCRAYINWPPLAPFSTPPASPSLSLTP
jgi:hypothetical protein